MVRKEEIQRKRGKAKGKRIKYSHKGVKFKVTHAFKSFAIKHSPSISLLIWLFLSILALSFLKVDTHHICNSFCDVITTNTIFISYDFGRMFF